MKYRNFLLCCLVGISFSFEAVEYNFKQPVRSSAVVTENNGMLFIECRFSPTRIFSRQMNKKVDIKYSKRIAVNALRFYLDKKSDALELSGLTSSRQSEYASSKECRYFFQIPKASVKVLKRAAKKAPVKFSPKHEVRTLTAAGASLENTVPAAEENLKKPVVAAVLPENVLITDAELKQLEFSGHVVRIKQDIQNIFDDFQALIFTIAQKKDRDALDSLLQLKKKTDETASELEQNIQDDSLLVSSEIKMLLQLIRQRQSQFNNQFTQTSLLLITFLSSDIKEQIRKLQKNSSDDSNDTKELIGELQKELQSLNDLKNRIQKNR